MLPNDPYTHIAHLTHLLKLSEKVHEMGERLYLYAGNPDTDLLIAGIAFQTALQNYREAKKATQGDR